MDAQAITNILLGLLSIGLPTATFLYASKANHRQAHAEELKAEVEEKGVDAQAYTRAAELYEGMVAALRTEVDRLHESNKQLADEVAALRSTNLNLVIEIATLRRANTTLNSEVASLRAEIDSLRK